MNITRRKLFIVVLIFVVVQFMTSIYRTNLLLKVPASYYRIIDGFSGTFAPILKSTPPEGYVYDDECRCRLLPSVDVHPTSTCGRLSTVRGNEQRVISFSFFLGNYSQENQQNDLCDLTSSKNHYLSGVKTNLDKIRKLYPGYAMRVYHDAPLNNTRCAIFDQLCSLFCQQDATLDLCNVRNIATLPEFETIFGMIWRFAPMTDAYVLEWHSRDLDAEIIQREIDAVREWKESKLGYHIMRDHPQHVADILGGMFGVLQNTLQRKLVASASFNLMVKEYGAKWLKENDQIALMNILSPSADEDSLVHDSYLCKRNFIKGSKSAPFPTQRLSGPNFTDPGEANFIGNFGTKTGITDVCPEECRPTHHKDWLLC